MKTQIREYSAGLPVKIKKESIDFLEDPEKASFHEQLRWVIKVDSSPSPIWIDLSDVIDFMVEVDELRKMFELI